MPTNYDDSFRFSNDSDHINGKSYVQAIEK